MTLMEPIVRSIVASVEDLELTDFRIRIPTFLKQRWDATCARKKISSQDAGAAMIEFLLNQPDAIQSGVFGQVDDETRVAAARWVIEQMAKPSSSRLPKETIVRKGKGTITQNGVTRPL